MSHRFMSAAVALAAFLLSSPAWAQEGARDHLAGWEPGGTSEARATVTGTEEKLLLHKKKAGHYSVCNAGSHPLAVTYDRDGVDLHSGDCVSVEAAKISAKGKHESAENKVVVFHNARPRGDDH